MGFVKAYHDRSQPKHLPYNPLILRDNLRKGQTAMNAIGDPLNCEGKLFSTLGKLFDQVWLQQLAVGVPYHLDYSKQQDKILRHLSEMAHLKQHDTFPLPTSVPQAVKVLDPSHP